MANFGHYRCLLADRDPFMRRLLREMLRFVGIGEIEYASDGTQAVLMVEESPFDLLITELDLPGLSGPTMINRIRRSKLIFDKAIPIIGYTATITPDLVMGARDAGIHEIMAKPFSANVLSKRMEAALVNSRPFVQGGAYVGPCRRRHSGGRPTYFGPFRREADRLAEEAKKKAEEAALAAAKAAELAAAAAPKIDPSAMSQEALAQRVGSRKSV